jgi:predicted metal-dependent enzyme (double-stranded beta helix superfamily)
MTGTRALGQHRLRRFVQQAAAAPDWLALVRYDPDQRWYHRLAAASDHELWLLSWLPGQETGFHDHGQSAGAFAVVLGALSERAAPRGWIRPGARPLAEGSVRSFGPRYVHNVSNPYGQPAVSIHAYSPPLAAMRRFEPGGDGRLRALAEAVSPW